MCRTSHVILAAVLLAAAGCRSEGPLAPAADDGRRQRPVLVEAEDCPTTGVVSPFLTTLHTPEAEASARRYVSLPPGGTLQLTAPIRADSLVLRLSYPDAPQGGGQDGVIGIDVGGESFELPVTSRFSWDYGRGRFNSADVWWSDPGQGQPRHFWDEASLRFPAAGAGTAITVRNPIGPARTILIDCAEFELVPAVAPPPAGSLSFADWHPDRTGGVEVTTLLQQAVDAAQAQGRTLYVPEGIYRIASVDVGGGRLQGAGMWRSRFIGPLSRFRFTGGAAIVSDVAIFGETTVRNDRSDADNAFTGRPGSGTRLERIWVEHKKCAYWVGDGSGSVDGLTIAACRFRNLMADAVNLYNGATNCVIEDCLVRNTGDDGLAAWSPAARGRPSGDIVIRRNVVQGPWLASGIALYGGGPFTVEDNTVSDTVTSGSGIFISASFKAWPFAGRIMVTGNTLVRCGAHESGPGGPTGAIRLLALDEDMTAATFVVSGNRVVAPLASAVSIQGPRAIANLLLSDLVVDALGTACLVDIRPNAMGSAVFSSIGMPGVADPSWPVPAHGRFTVRGPGLPPPGSQGPR